MRKFLVAVILCLCIICGLHVNSLYIIVANHQSNISQKDEGYYDRIQEKEPEEISIVYDVYADNKREAAFEFYADAVDFARSLQNASVYEHHTGNWVWDNYPPYELHVNNIRILYTSFEQAKAAAAEYDDPTITYKRSASTIWEKDYEKKGSHYMDIPLIKQLPELARGCEVTSLAMLLNFKGVEVDKMTLADEIERHENNPYKGFVGNIYTYNPTGYGVYHGPIFNLLQKYLPETAINMTGAEFEDLYYLLDHDNPVWVVTNARFSKLPSSEFVKWNTDEGPILITYREHAALITGYDENYIYFNDPLGNAVRAEKDDFIAAWEQMGKQAVSTAM